MTNTTPLQNEYELKDYHEPLFFKQSKNGGQTTHQALISHSAYTLAKMWLNGVEWKANYWFDILGETEKAVLVSFRAYTWWLPKKLVYKVRRKA